MTDDPAETARQVGVAMMAITEVLSPVVEAVQGYRASLNHLGYGDAVAQRMAADYHAALLRAVVPT